MMKNNDTLLALAETARALGADNASVIDASLIETDKIFRDICASNACGLYGKCWMCPPDAGDIDILMAKVKEYDLALVYQLIGSLEDSFDFEGMAEAKKEHYRLSQKIKDHVNAQGYSKVLHLGAGGCGVCDVCAKREGEPCRFPDLAMSSIEAYGINASRLAATAGMKYINGANTVTYFGVALFSL